MGGNYTVPAFNPSLYVFYVQNAQPMQKAEYKELE